jgi:hypothetical protein
MAESASDSPGRTLTARKSKNTLPSLSSTHSTRYGRDSRLAPCLTTLPPFVISAIRARTQPVQQNAATPCGCRLNMSTRRFDSAPKCVPAHQAGPQCRVAANPSLQPPDTVAGRHLTNIPQARAGSGSHRLRSRANPPLPLVRPMLGISTKNQLQPPAPHTNKTLLVPKIPPPVSPCPRGSLTQSHHPSRPSRPGLTKARGATAHSQTT